MSLKQNLFDKWNKAISVALDFLEKKTFFYIDDEKKWFPCNIRLEIHFYAIQLTALLQINWEQYKSTLQNNDALQMVIRRAESSIVFI